MITLFIFFSGCNEDDIEGCMNIESCNYNTEANIDDGSCIYPEENFDCDEYCIVDYDCLGVCGGDAVLDECGMCNGQNINMDCAGNCGGDAVKDCLGECEGSALIDACGICDGDGYPCTECADGSSPDCSGLCGGIAEFDCEGVCGGDAIIDECGACNGNGCSCLNCPDLCTDDYVCIDETACNYGSEGSCDECNYPEENIDCEGNCLSEELMPSWNVQIKASVQPWNNPGLDLAYDYENYFGAKISAEDGYDSEDIPEPPSGGCTNCLSAYFMHPEWDYDIADNFTTDIKSTSEFCNLKSWELTVYSSSFGDGQLEFNYTDVPEDMVIMIFSEEDSTLIHDNYIMDISLEANSVKQFLINVSW